MEKDKGEPCTNWGCLLVAFSIFLVLVGYAFLLYRLGFWHWLVRMFFNAEL